MGYYEFRANPTFKNGLGLEAGLAGGIGAMHVGEELIADAALITTTMAASEVVFPAVGLIALTTLGVFAGKAGIRIAYDASEYALNKVSTTWSQNFKN